MNLQLFKINHPEFFDMLLDDTWLSEEPIKVEEVIACWKWAIKAGYEKVPIEVFEITFGIPFQYLTDYWNKEVLKIFE